MIKALALDLGASGGKFLLGSFNGHRLEVNEIHRFSNGPVHKGGHLFWDIHQFYSELLIGLRKAAAEGISSFGVDSFSNDYGLVDPGGKLLSQIYMYRDRRTDRILERMDRMIPPKDLFQRTGCQRAQFNTLVQLVAQTGSPEQSLLRKGNTLLFIPDLLNFMLTGEKAAEFTIASVSQVYNQVTCGWDEELLTMFDIPVEILPTVILSATSLGSVKADILDQTGGQPFGITLVGHHDTASAVAAVPSLDEHFAYISSGTWSLMGTETRELITSDSAFQNNFANEGGVEKRNRFLRNSMGLWLLQECQQQMASSGLVRSFEQMEQEANLAPAFRSIIDPDHPLLFHRGDMVGRLQSLCRDTNQPVPESVGEITRCILESLALAYRATLEKLEELTGFTLPRVHIIGGGGKSRALNQFAASAMKRPVYAGPFEAAAIGNLCVQFISMGEIKDLQEARNVILKSFEMQEFQPGVDKGWDDAYARFLALRKQHQDMV